LKIDNTNFYEGDTVIYQRSNRETYYGFFVKDTNITSELVIIKKTRVLLIENNGYNIDFFDSSGNREVLKCIKLNWYICNFILD
jgi:hypothetical protein